MFSFVDRIVETDSGNRARGTFTVPHGGGELPPALAAEAVGQLAAWVAMARTGFARRPVAGLAREVRGRGSVKEGTELDLEARIETFREDVIAYDGWARVGTDVVLTLKDCVCPLLPLADFDDPGAVRSRFADLVAGSSQPTALGSSHPTALASSHPTAPGWPPAGMACVLGDTRLEEVKRQGPGSVFTAELTVPASAPYFADHFPRKPVFPGTLLLEAMTRIAVLAAREALGPRAAPVREVAARDVKIRAFTPPGAHLAFRAETLGAGRREATIAIEVRGLDPPSAGAASLGRVVAGARVSVLLGDGP